MELNVLGESLCIRTQIVVQEADTSAAAAGIIGILQRVPVKPVEIISAAVH